MRWVNVSRFGLAAWLVTRLRGTELVDVEKLKPTRDVGLVL